MKHEAGGGWLVEGGGWDVGRYDIASESEASKVSKRDSRNHLAMLTISCEARIKVFYLNGVCN